MLIHFKDWRKKRSKEEKKRIHEMRIFELIFEREIRQHGLIFNTIEMISIYCLADEKFNFSYKVEALNEVVVDTPYNFQHFLELESDEEKFIEFEKLIHSYVVPIFCEFSTLSRESILRIVNSSLKQIVDQNYEAVFLTGKTPRKSPNREKTAILKGIHRSKGFQLYCEVFDKRGFRIINKLLAEEIGNESLYARFLGELKWESDSKIVVKSPFSSWQAVIET